jgi:hypothetical protein
MRRDRPALTVALILAWADAHRARTGRWPSEQSGPVEGAPGETWLNVHQALQRGLRGLPGGDSLARLLARERGKRHPAELPPLTEGRIVAWARAHRKAAGRWPTAESGPVAGVPGETWQGLDGALRGGSRGLPGGSTLARLLARRVGKPYLPDRPPLSVAQAQVLVVGACAGDEGGRRVWEAPAIEAERRRHLPGAGHCPGPSCCRWQIFLAGPPRGR